MDLSWDGPDPSDRARCPYAVDFYCKPAPAGSLNSLESGRLLLRVDLGADVTSVTCQLVNNAKRENLGRFDTASVSEIKRQTSISTTFAQGTEQPKRWLGELSIPTTWVEGGTRIHERTATASPKSSTATATTTADTNLYTLEITYVLNNGNSCTARFCSEDAFHWQAR